MSQQAAREELIIDGSGAILGRLATYVAKQLLSGKRVTIVNADKVAVSGDPVRLVYFYRRTILGVKVHLSEKWRPKRARSPQMLVRKAVRGMLPKNDKGKEAYSRLRVYVGVPKELAGKNTTKLPSNMTVEKLTKSKYATLADIARQLGWSR
ncbi:50S ribosomal protein L13 [Acidilobus saccharovorans]|uniref:50S ribosomal protein L13 n=1 Tax=Acidilobus saccharovorans TaxID=242703 RepID=UPI000A54A7B7|nr:50S ribosomal protein L13 [Acidilobus saccharovorans]